MNNGATRWNSPRQLIYEYCKKSQLGEPMYEIVPDPSTATPHFFCTLQIKDEIFAEETSFSSKRAAYQALSAKACRHYKLDFVEGNSPANQREGNSYTPKPRGFAISNTIPMKKQKLEMEIPDQKCYSVQSVDDMISCLSREQLSGMFKTMLHFFAQNEGNPNVYPSYTTEQNDINGSKYFVSTMSYEGYTFKSLGLMATVKQAELSAAEVCLRSLGHLPKVSCEEDFCIQPYKGGYSGVMPRNLSMKVKSFFNGISRELGVLSPKYKVKQSDDKFIGVVHFDGKIFENLNPQNNYGLAKLEAIQVAISYFGITDYDEAITLRSCFKLKRKPTYKKLATPGGPFEFSPSQQKGWLHNKYLDINLNMTGNEDDDKLKSLVMEIKEDNELKSDPYLYALSKTPSFQGQCLSDRKDISIAEISSDQPNVFIVGNKLFSMKIFCENKKIFSKTRSKQVDLLPGHRIEGLVCSYKVCFPSLQVYLKAESCTDVYFPNPPLPVITSCGAVVMMHDNEAQNEIFILLKREVPDRPFLKTALALKNYLPRLLNGLPCSLDVPRITDNISSWRNSEVKALSLMTLDSMVEVFSKLWKYDDRCNEIFFKELSQDLNLLKETCAKEEKRRENIKQEKDEEKDGWELPKTNFQHRLISSGVFIEPSAFCMYRGMKEDIGIDFKLGEIERSQFIDEPITDNPNPHRGDMRRYFIWSHFKKFSIGEEDTYLKEEEMILANSSSKWVSDTTDRKQTGDYKRTSPLVKTNVSNVKNVEQKEEGDDSEENKDDKAQDNDESISDTKDNVTTYRKLCRNELRWFKISEAKEICNELASLSNNELFKEEQEALKHNASEFWRKKRMGLTQVGSEKKSSELQYSVDNRREEPFLQQRTSLDADIDNGQAQNRDVGYTGAYSNF